MNELVMYLNSSFDGDYSVLHIAAKLLTLQSKSLLIRTYFPLTTLPPPPLLNRKHVNLLNIYGNT
jgi:hypothetical protein